MDGLAATLVGGHREAVTQGRQFFKMSGSGNDFIVLDGRSGSEVIAPEQIRRLCARGTGVGADGVVVIENEPGADFRMLYFNSDGSRAAMCGNAALCVTRLAAKLGVAPAGGMRFESDSGPITGRMAEGGLPEIDLALIRVVRPDAAIERIPGERRIGFADAGVPHLVVRCDDVAEVDVNGRGAPLRTHSSLSAGANVNFVSEGPDGWRIRTFERGVEGETLACGTGAVASAVLLAEWGESAEETSLRTRSGELLVVRLKRVDGGWAPTLSGQGRIVYVGELAEL